VRELARAFCVAVGSERGANLRDPWFDAEVEPSGRVSSSSRAAATSTQEATTRLGMMTDKLALAGRGGRSWTTVLALAAIVAFGWFSRSTKNHDPSDLQGGWAGAAGAAVPKDVQHAASSASAPVAPSASSGASDAAAATASASASSEAAHTSATTRSPAKALRTAPPAAPRASASSVAPVGTRPQPDGPGLGYE
jgi:predicted lipid-binding transport protein (Tim44 family)